MPKFEPNRCKMFMYLEQGVCQFLFKHFTTLFSHSKLILSQAIDYLCSINFIKIGSVVETWLRIAHDSCIYYKSGHIWWLENRQSDESNFWKKNCACILLKKTTVVPSLQSTYRLIHYPHFNIYAVWVNNKICRANKK